MKILLIHPHEVFSEIEPWTSRILNIALKLSSLGHDVKLVHFPLKEYRLPNPHNYKQIEIIALSRKIGLGIFFDNIKKLCTLSRWADIVHFQKCYYYASVPALLAAFITNKPIHYDWDDWELKIFFYPKKQSRLTGVFLGTTEFLIPYLVDTISVASKKLKEVCLKRGIFEDRIFKASVGADLDKFNPYISREVVRSKFNIDGPLVVYVGQLHGAQYCELFIKAAGSVLKSNPNTTFMVVGDGYRLPSLRKIAQDVGLDGRLIFSGAVSHDQVPFYISSADVAVACFEKNDITLCKSPLKVAEYMACGKAIVASDVGELKNMVGGVGLLTKPGDVDSLSYGIDRILKNEPLGKTLGVLARERAVEKYNWEYTAMNLLKAYNFAFYLRNRSHYELILQASKDAKLEKDEDNNTFMEFESFIKFDGIYDISLKYASTSKRQGASYLDNGLINHFYFDTHTSDKEKFKWLRIKRIYLKSNFHKLKLVFGDFPTDVSHVKFFKVK